MDLEILKEDAQLEHVGSLGDCRELFRVPISRIGTAEPFTHLRGKNPGDKDFEVMARSVVDRGIFYPPLAYAELVGKHVNLTLVDGHQRYRAARDSGAAHIVVCICTSWTSVDEALRDGISVQWAKFRLDEPDLLSLAMTKKVTAAEMATLTGVSESKVRQIASVADHPELAAICQEGLVTSSRMSTLIKRCENNPEKLRVLTNTFRLRATHARKEAKRWETKIKVERHKKWDRKAKAKADPAQYFASENWSNWEEALGESKLPAQIKEEQDLKVLDLGGKQKLAIRIGDDEEWKEHFAVFNFAEKKHDDVDLESLGEFVACWNELGDRVRNVYEQRLRQQALTAVQEELPAPQVNPVVASNEDVDDEDEPRQQRVDQIRVAD